MALEPIFPSAAFASLDGITHVCAAGESLPLNSHHAALAKYLAHKSGGHRGRHDQNQQLDAVRNLISRLWKVPFDDVGFVSSVAEAVSMVLESLDWKEGDNVCVDTDEYPSLVAPFAIRSQRQPSTSPTIRYSTDGNLARMVDVNTRLIAVSYVSYLNSARVDLARYRQLADSVGAILVVDYTQAAGYTTIDASVADFAFSACYKWLLGTTGASIAIWNRSRQPEWKPSTAGWFSLSLGESRPNWTHGGIDTKPNALCFSRGNPGHLSIYLLREGLEFLSQWDMTEIEQHVQILTTELLDRLQKEGIPSSTPKQKDRHGASVTIDCAGASEIVDKLSDAGIYAWNGRGRVRFSFHGYNSMRDVDRIMDVFPALWRVEN
ncbi:hypothetical protein Plec18167_004243 [Paecilomyces lecythidis]|uniref:Aminotransferase class V domain-containing protein n=1 Tax=Paecilomyces lecythidis TaxID=3004212 RepID=A0ABR3XSG6_9EURO